MSSHIRTWLLLALAAIAVLLALLFVTVLAARQATFYNNCDEARANHDTNIPEGSSFYRPELDRDKDGYACE